MPSKNSTPTVEFDASRIDELSALAVPNWVRGVWQRTSMRTNGSESNDANVIWIQTPTLYADIRVPSGSRDGAHSTAEGFAGWLRVEHQVCRWQRPVDLNPGGEDAGAMFRDGITLREVGLFDNYLEDYCLLDPASHCFAASRGGFEAKEGGVYFAPEGPLDILVSAGTYITHARRRESSALRHGHYDAHHGLVSFDVTVGDPSVFAYDDGPWTIWTDEVGETEREVLLSVA